MTASCSNCKFWTRWRLIMAMMPPNPQVAGAAIGHCVILKCIDANISVEHPQGLTGEDFYCHAYKERGANE